MLSKVEVGRMSFEVHQRIMRSRRLQTLIFNEHLESSRAFVEFKIWPRSPRALIKFWPLNEAVLNMLSGAARPGSRRCRFEKARHVHPATRLCTVSAQSVMSNLAASTRAWSRSSQGSPAS
jgi:hypothetical protein